MSKNKDVVYDQIRFVTGLKPVLGQLPERLKSAKTTKLEFMQ